MCLPALSTTSYWISLSASPPPPTPTPELVIDRRTAPFPASFHTSRRVCFPLHCRITLLLLWNVASWSSFELLISHLMHRNPSRCPFSLGCGKRSLSLLACCRFSFFQFATPTCMRLAWQVKKKFWGNKPARFCVCVYVCSLVILRGHLLLERLPKLPCKCTTHDVVSLVTWHLTPETGNQSWDFCYFFIQSWLFFFFFLQSEAISGSSGESIVNNCKFMFIRAWNGHDWMRVILFQDVFCQEISSWL